MKKSLPFHHSVNSVLFNNIHYGSPGQRLSAADQNTLDRLNQLEAEAQALRAEVQSDAAGCCAFAEC